MFNDNIVSRAMSKTDTMLSVVLLVLLMLSCLVYVQNYSNEIQNNENVSDATKKFISFVPMLFAISIVVTAGYGIYVATRKR